MADGALPPRRRCLQQLAALGLAGTLASPPVRANESLVVGRSFPLTGPLRTYGDAKRDGGDAYLKKVNEAGGVGGRPIQAITLDDVYAPDKTVANMRSLASGNRLVAYLGLFGVPTVAAALPVLLELKIPGVGLTSGTAALRKPHNPYAFPVRASYADEARKLVAHIQTIGLTRVGVVYTDNPFGESVRDTLLATLKAEGLSATVVKLDPPGKEAARAVKEVLAADPQSIFLTMLSQPAVPTLTELNRARGHVAAVYAFSPVDTTLVTQQLGGAARGLAITQIVPIPQGSRVKVVAEYIDALKRLGQGTPSFYGLEGFIEAKVLVEGLRRAGPGATAQSLKQALETMREWDAGGFFVSYTPEQHVGSRFVEIDAVTIGGALLR